MEALDLAGVVIAAVSGLLLTMVVRRRLLGRHGGTIDMPLHLQHRWRHGFGRYDGTRLVWYATFSLSPRPRYAWARSTLQMGAPRAARGAESAFVPPGAVVVACLGADPAAEVALAAAALPGLLAWLEAAPLRLAA